MSSASPLGKLLREFAERLGPDAEAEEAIRKIIDEISECVESVVGESLDRIAPLGSYAKKTALAGEMDLDVVLFLNREDDPPYADVLEKLKGCFKKVKGAKNVTLKAHSLALHYKGMKVDILTAQNMLMLSPLLSDINDNVNHFSCVQHALTLQKIKQRVGKRKPIVSGRAWNISQVFSTSLSEAAEVFAKQQSSFGHTLAKLAKYWNKRIITGIYFSARSSIIEYIAFKIAENEKDRPEGEDLYRAFRDFLLYISQPEKINIYWCMFYREEDIPPYNRVTPCIIDPTNPYNNLIYEKQLDLLKEIGKCAHVTLIRMQKYEDWDQIVPFHSLATTLLFWPQLTAEFRQSLSEQKSTSKPVLMDITNTNNSSKGSSELYHPGQKRSSHQDSKPSKSRRLTSLESSRLQSAIDCAVMVVELLFGKEVAGRFRRERQNQANFSRKHSLDECLMIEVGLVILSGEQYSKIESIAKKISQFAKKVKFRGTVVRVKLSGIYAKKTAMSLFSSPVDIVVFLDCKGSPPYVNYLQEFEKVLREYFTVELVGDYLLVYVEDYIVRVKTGKNFAQSCIDIPISQLNGVLRCIKKTKKKQMLQQVQFFSASLSEAPVQFFEQQGSFSRQLSILAKLCMLHIIPDITDLFEMEVLIELLCVWVTNTEKMEDKQIGKALEAFLQTIMKLRYVDIWWDDFYHLGDFSDVPESIPRVLDPANPYLNLLQGKDDQFFLTMRNRASEMLKRLEEVKGYQNEHIDLGIFYLFSPTD